MRINLKKSSTSVVVFIFIILISFHAVADYEKGQEAASSGDYETAFMEFTPLAEQGNASAQNQLGWMYFCGQGVTQNFTAAFLWFKLAAEQGNVEAQYGLGWLYYRGRGVTQNFTDAFKWTRLAAEQGEANAQYVLGEMYSRELGGDQNLPRAYMWWDIAVRNGLEDAKGQRDGTVRAMTNEQLKKALDLVTKCVAKNYKECDAMQRRNTFTHEAIARKMEAERKESNPASPGSTGESMAVVYICIGEETGITSMTGKERTIPVGFLIKISDENATLYSENDNTEVSLSVYEQDRAYILIETPEMVLNTILHINKDSGVYNGNGITPFLGTINWFRGKCEIHKES